MIKTGSIVTTWPRMWAAGQSISAALCLLCLATPENLTPSTFQPPGSPSCFLLTLGNCHDACIWRDSLPSLSGLRVLTLFQGAQDRWALAAPLPDPLRLQNPRHPHLHHIGPASLELHVHRRVGNRAKSLTGMELWRPESSEVDIFPPSPEACSDCRAQAVL